MSIEQHFIHLASANSENLPSVCTSHAALLVQRWAGLCADDEDQWVVVETAS